MQAHLPLWFQRLPSDVRRRLELAEAAAVEARRDTHARQALNLVAVLSSRLPFDEAVDRYVEIMGLGGDEGENVHNRALVALGDSDLASDLARERHRTGWGLNWRYATPLGAVRFVRRRLKRNAEEDLWLELSAARAEEALVRTHIRFALTFIEIMGDHAPPPRSVALYLDQLEVPAARARAVYQRTLARVADAELPRLKVQKDGELVEDSQRFRFLGSEDGAGDRSAD
jgi:hypothetical protein